MTDLSGQIENAGHFLQPVARAMGHRVIWVPLSIDPAYAFCFEVFFSF
jgi:hypothetical protein